MKISIVGSGFAESTAAYTLVIRGRRREIVLVDQDKKTARAETDDIFRVVRFAGMVNVYAGAYGD